MRKSILVLATTALAVLVVCGAAWADTFTVTNTNNSGAGSLRAAITRANAHAGKDVVSFAPGVRGTIELKSALPGLSGQLDIRGPGAGKLSVRRSVASHFGIFEVSEGSDVSISGLTISDGSSLMGGGGIENNDGELTLRGVYLSNNSADHYGGGLSNGGEATVINSTFSNNSAGQFGGGIMNWEKLTVVGSTFFENTASGPGVKGGGGAIHNDNLLRVVNSTFVGNAADNESEGAGLGGGILGHMGEVAIVGSTFSNNTATSTGGGVYDGHGSTMFSQMSIFAGNEAERHSPDVSGTFNSRGYNLIGEPGNATGFRATDLTNVDAGFDPRGLRNYGGPTRTMALTQESPAVDAVARDACVLEEDQRGVRRPKDGDGNGVARCDIGAFERAAPSSQ